MAPEATVAGVALVTLDRPKALNALSFDLLRELADTLERLDADEACRAIVLTGAGTRAFAAGADIRELAGQTSASLAAGHDFDAWGRIDAIGLPAHRGRAWLRPRWRLRAGDGLRPASSPATTRRSASPRSRSGSCPAPAGPSG